ncbi:MAG TPA: hypothetical protein VGQ62_05645 [Chloroflexota bacterium]|jgi:hypothetical protein|nr:hypothetical protein [Chloroflexota bacterium]
MFFEARCPQCRFVTQQLGQPTPCLLHVSISPEADLEADPADEIEEIDQPVAALDYDEPYAFGELRITVDRPGPFTLREYVRLQLLRSRVQARPSALDAPAAGAQAPTLLRR